ncbi:S9 family peptidase [Psychroflexus sp. YR1-1]|uniref:Acyl-peptide hydrolase n=1 Tax=Psychroflexus aurantiacus TaxID=2709310 RepID=A0A6B3R1W9_9FLAO|nr:S9 family peptidase [Psychroflexus aurantiacus]NEV93057.1 S9 family peptidase [Psychroflexus aurantiacus]
MKYSTIHFLVFSLFLCFTSQIQAQIAEDHFGYMDLFDLQMVSNPAISPDGKTIIYERHQFDVMTDRRLVNLWQISFDGTKHYPITTGTEYHGNVTWSPQGDKFAFTSNQEGANQLYVYWTASNTAAAITNFTESPSSISWSPDGSQLLFSKFVPESSKAVQANLPNPPAGAQWEEAADVIDKTVYRRDGGGYVQDGYRHLFVISAEGGTARQLTSGPHQYGSPSWGPDGNHIIYTVDKSEAADLDPNNEQIYQQNLITGEVKQLTNARGPYYSPKISPDGKYIAYTGFKDEFVGYQLTKLYLMDREGGSIQVLSENFAQDISSITWAQDSKSVYFRYDEEGNSKVGNIDMSGNVISIARDLGSASIGRPYGGGSYSVSNKGYVAFSHVTPSTPSELAVVGNKSNSDPRLLTRLNENLLKSEKLGEVKEFWVDSSVDDFKIQGWVITPPDFDSSKTYPLILEIHGGPYTNYGSRFSPELQFMASKGYVVVYTNPRGSTSYGEDFAAYINHNYPSEDYNDLMDATDYVIDQGYVDTDNLFITGGSGGGVLTAWSIGKTDRFQAAVVAKPVINWYSFVLTADASPFFSKYWFKDMPWESPEDYLKFSPISLVGNVKTPTMLLTGQQDYRTPMSETEQYYTALKLQGIEAVMVRIAGSGHGIAGKPSNLFRKVEYITNWFDKYKN